MRSHRARLVTLRAGLNHPAEGGAFSRSHLGTTEHPALVFVLDTTAARSGRIAGMGKTAAAGATRAPAVRLRLDRGFGVGPDHDETRGSCTSDRRFALKCATALPPMA
jgi:hypothetical protein